MCGLTSPAASQVCPLSLMYSICTHNLLLRLHRLKPHSFVLESYGDLTE